MRIRTIKPEFWAHPVMVRQTDATKLLAIGLLNYADDEGFFYAEAKLVRAALRPLDEDSTIVRASLDALSRIGFLAFVEHPTHGPIGRVINFSSHQRVDRPSKSKIRPFFADCPPQSPAKEEPSLFVESSSSLRRTLAAIVPQDRGIEGSGIEGSGNGKDAAPAAVVPVSELPIEVTFPDALNTIEFKAAWLDWLAYRRERRLPAYKSKSVAAQLKELADWGHEAAIASIRESIRQQWQGLFAPKATGRTGTGPALHTKAPTAEDHGKGFFHNV